MSYEPKPRPKADSSILALYLTSDKKRYNPHKSEQRKAELQASRPILKVGSPVKIESYLVIDGENPARRVYGIDAHAHRIADKTISAILKAKGRPITEADRVAAHKYHQKAVGA